MPKNSAKTFSGKTATYKSLIWYPKAVLKEKEEATEKQKKTILELIGPVAGYISAPACYDSSSDESDSDSNSDQIQIQNLIQSLVQSQRIPRVIRMAATVITVSAATKKALVLRVAVSTRRMEGRSRNGARSLISSKTATTRSITARMLKCLPSR